VQSAVFPAGVPDNATDFFALKAEGAGLISLVLIVTLRKPFINSLK
jgi:hypothetical protein